ncbi:MAG: 2Fe-2S iron-sulfur cluster binding domain-containing protein [Treponema sp.]|jgi:carbon-monoxide dehydrogenase small subunit|nr:2Fe-2S iron-sulfur cluster binding domain-containing protein [Treponema sp.]
MTIRFILNGEDMEIDAEANQRLINILRDQFSLTAAKEGCLKGSCGACAVIYNGSVSPACLIPAFRIQGSEIITLEGFSQTMEYQDIAAGFARAGVDSCGFCDAGKILAAEMLLEEDLRPSREEFTASFRGIRCGCTDTETLYQGVLSAGEERQKRIYGRSA